MKIHHLLIFLSASMLLLSGCTAGPSVTGVKGPDGSEIKQVKCVKNSSECFSTASESCNGGPYQVLDSESHAGGLLADYLKGPVTWYSFNYKCGPSDGRLPTFPFDGQQYIPPTIINNTTNNSSAPVNTNCTKFGNNINCTSF